MAPVKDKYSSIAKSIDKVLGNFTYAKFHEKSVRGVPKASNSNEISFDLRQLNMAKLVLM